MEDEALKLLECQLKEMRSEILNNVVDETKDEVFKLKLKQAKYIALNTLYPFDLDIDELPKRIEMDWQVRCAIELYGKMDSMNVQTYSENGLSISYFTGFLSKELISELTPKAGVIK